MSILPVRFMQLEGATVYEGRSPTVSAIMDVGYRGWFGDDVPNRLTLKI